MWFFFFHFHFFPTFALTETGTKWCSWVHLNWMPNLCWLLNNYLQCTLLSLLLKSQTLRSDTVSKMEVSCVCREERESETACVWVMYYRTEKEGPGPVSKSFSESLWLSLSIGRYQHVTCTSPVRISFHFLLAR